MDSKIKTKFTIASEEGIALLQMLGEKRGQEKYASILDTTQLENYLYDKFNTATIINNLNTFSNQLIVVYVADQPAGYAYLSGNGNVPDDLQDKRMIHLEDFEVLQEYQGSGAKEVLMEKCLSVGKSYEAIKIRENAEEMEMIAFYEQYGFQQRPSPEISIAGKTFPSVILIRAQP
ncbi:GNAT family N-acetyltransferase [Pedobacter gandavensis]|uniref:GNAT family N-acetyltransferase n=1 Tax=Pedobacter gandavensis TaxID=2679963 RepID=A0ABR6F245_9SPHI|nr:GNAT family N-acetyltransferase [Pedobacter gandavensis]MBB2151610.1 GNAT family N-acetyltransferase [Pedobacter gandavensis]